MDTDKDFAGAKALALRLIKFRPRSEREIRDKLQEKAYSSGVIEEVIAFLKKTKLLDDALFARLWVQSRLSRPTAPKKLRYELEHKGVDAAIIDTVLGETESDYDQAEVVRGIVEARTRKMAGLSPEKIRSRLYAYLSRRGFAQDLIMETLTRIVR